MSRSGWGAAVPASVAALALLVGCKPASVAGTATVADASQAPVESDAAQPLTVQPGAVAPAATAPGKPSTTTTTTTATSTSTSVPASTRETVTAQAAAPPAPPPYSPEAHHICLEIQQSRMAPDQYRRYIQGQPSFAWMTPQDKADLASGVRMARTGSCG